MLSLHGRAGAVRSAERTRLGLRQYQIVETLGSGGFGRVYRADLIGTGGFRKQVAVKLLRQDRAITDDMVSRLRDEARMLGMLSHPAILRVDDLVHLDVGWAVITEYVPGVDLTPLILHGPLPISVALSIVEEVAGALHAAWHATGPDGQPLHLIHRDIKPANIRVSPTGEVKVLDYGVATAEFSARESDTSAMVLGSKRYMAPERLEHIERPRGDIFGLGQVLTECLLGPNVEPVPHRDRQHRQHIEDLMGRIMRRVQRDHPELPLSTGKYLAQLVRSMLELYPDARPTAQDLVKACRLLRKSFGTLWLREWAEQVIPRYEALTRSDITESRGAILREVHEPEPDRSDDTEPIPRDEDATEIFSSREAVARVLSLAPTSQDSAPQLDLPMLDEAPAEPAESPPVEPPPVDAWAPRVDTADGPEPAFGAASHEPFQPPVAPSLAAPLPADTPRRRWPLLIGLAAVLPVLLVLLAPVALLTLHGDDSDEPVATEAADGESKAETIDAPEHAVAPAPGPEPVDAAAAPDTTPDTTPGATGSVSFKGDADSSCLETPDGCLTDGAVPVGTWRVMASFRGEAARAVTTATVAEGVTTTVTCSRSRAICRAR